MRHCCYCSLGFGGLPELRRLIKFLSKSNQKGAPRDIAITVIDNPKIFFNNHPGLHP